MDGAGAIAALGLRLPELRQGGEDEQAVLSGGRVDAEGGQSGVQLRQEGQQLVVVQAAFHLAPAGWQMRVDPGLGEL